MSKRSLQNEINRLEGIIEESHIHLDRAGIMRDSIDYPGERIRLDRRCGIAATREMDAEHVIKFLKKKLCEVSGGVAK